MNSLIVTIAPNLMHCVVSEILGTYTNPEIAIEIPNITLSDYSKLLLRTDLTETEKASMRVFKRLLDGLHEAANKIGRDDCVEEINN